MKNVDTKERESQVLDLVIESYIDESRPISSSFLRERFNLSYSSATVRNVMYMLEQKGLLSHVHTSSGRVPTKKGFKQYVERLKTEGGPEKNVLEALLHTDETSTHEELFQQALEVLSLSSGYTSLVSMWGAEPHLFMRGMRFMLEQPEFEDIARLKNLFYALEVKIAQLQQLLFDYVDEELKILVGDEIGFEEIEDCSLLISGLQKHNLSCVLAVLGPIRMNYTRALGSLHAVRESLGTVIGGELV